jgi:ABC-type hemin transport system substrate-binding protein
MTIVPFLQDSVFRPQDVQAMSTALEDVCNILNVAEEAKSQREQLAKKIITLAHQYQCNAALLRDRVLREIAYSQGEWAAVLVRAARRGALLIQKQ